MRRGLMVGVPVGALAGIALIAVALPGVATTGIGGAGRRAVRHDGWRVPRRLARLLAEVRLVDDEERWAARCRGSVLLAVRTHGREDQVIDLLRRHGSRRMISEED